MLYEAPGSRITALYGSDLSGSNSLSSGVQWIFRNVSDVIPGALAAQFPAVKPSAPFAISSFIMSGSTSNIFLEFSNADAFQNASASTLYSIDWESPGRFI